MGPILVESAAKIFCKIMCSFGKVFPKIKLIGPGKRAAAFFKLLQLFSNFRLILFYNTVRKNIEFTEC